MSQQGTRGNAAMHGGVPKIIGFIKWTAQDDWNWIRISVDFRIGLFVCLVVFLRTIELLSPPLYRTEIGKSTGFPVDHR